MRELLTRTFSTVLRCIRLVLFENLLPGQFVWIFGGYLDALEARRAGLQLRDTVLVVGDKTETAFLFRKPLEGTLGQTVLKYATGVLHIDSGRINESSRWPSNLLLVHSSTCNSKCTTGCAIEALTHFGIKTSGSGCFIRKSSASFGYAPNSYGKESRPEGTEMISYGDSGYASRFFPQFENTEAAYNWLNAITRTNQ